MFAVSIFFSLSLENAILTNLTIKIMAPAEKRKYPKQFYDDGLGDILEWIDDEVLVHSESDLRKRESNKEDAESSKRDSKKLKKKDKIYGENKPSEEKYKAPQRVKFVALDDGSDSEEHNLDKNLENRARGLINRLAAQTMPFVSSEFEKLYSTHQRSAVNAIIFKNIETSVISKNALTKRKLVAELMLLVSYLSSKISDEIGASLVHTLVAKFEKLYKTDCNDEDKSLNNIMCCLVNLYLIGLIGSKVIFEVTKRICSRDFKPKSVELLILIVQSVGFQLRKDDPSLMRQLIVMAQTQARTLKSDSELGKRVEFMIEALDAIRNNNVNKLGNYGCDIDTDTIELTLKSLMQRKKLPETLSDASYEEILYSSNWYLLETRLDDDKSATKDNATKKVETSSKTDLKICKALGLNKPSERTVFSALLRASDYIEASNVIIGFGMNHCSDAMLVCIHVAIHEKKYNPFHFELINNLCKFNRRYKMAAKFAIQDKIRCLSQMNSARVSIFQRLCLELVKSDAIPITILKAVEWADLNQSTKTFLTYMLEGISALEDTERRKIMSKVESKSSFAGAMRTFINTFAEDCELFR